MQEIETPGEGVTLSYDLSPGSVLDGHVVDRSTAGSTASGGNQIVEFDVSMLIKTTDDAGNSLVKARVKNLKLDHQIVVSWR